jgi:hypothetical protein
MTSNAGNRKSHPVNSGSFKRGPDPKRNTKGQTSPETVKLSADIKGWLTSIGGELSAKRKGQTYAESVARTLWERAERGDIRAAEIVIDRICGKIPLGLEHSGEFTFRRIDHVIKTETD